MLLFNGKQISRYVICLANLLTQSRKCLHCHIIVRTVENLKGVIKRIGDIQILLNLTILLNWKEDLCKNITVLRMLNRARVKTF